MQSVIDTLAAASGGGFNLAAKAAVMALDGRIVSALPADAAPSMAASIRAVQAFFGADWSDGDVAILSDPNQGCTHVCQLTAVSARFSGGRITGWTAARVNVPDLGGWMPGGYAPQAVDRWAEAARFEPARLLAQGCERREVLDLLTLNTRTPRALARLARAVAHAAQDLARVASAADCEPQWARDSARVAEVLRGASARSGHAAVDVRVPAGWTSPGRVEVDLAAYADRIAVAIDAPTLNAWPVNLTLAATQDIVAAALAATLGLDDLRSGALAATIDIQVSGDLLCAPVPACVGIGRETAGAALYEATCAAATALCGRGAAAEAWRGWLRRETSGNLDWKTGALDEPSSRRALSTELEMPQ